LKQLRYCRAVVFALAAVLMTGCATTEPEPTYYVLTGLRSGGTRSHPPGAVDVYVRRIEVPAYIAKPGLITVKGGTQVEYADTNLWAEPLDQGLSRAVAEDLNQHSHLRAFGFTPTASPPDHSYDVWIRLERFEGTDDGHAVLRARWWVSAAENSDSIGGRTTQITRSGWHPGDYGALVRLFRSEVRELSRQIAAAIPAVLHP
jgi:uncharacterized lipoprotein YmbA